MIVLNRRQIFYIVAGILAFFLMVCRRKRYPEIPIWKMAVIMGWVTVSGILSLKLLYFIENGEFGGDSWFGTVLFMPVFMIPLAALLKIPYRRLMNLYTPTQTFESAIGKIDCLISDCCYGKYLPSLEIQFPSQLADMLIAGFAVTFILLMIERNKPKLDLYPWLMILFGSARFVLDWFRYIPKPWEWGVPKLAIWALLSVLTGIVWLAVNRQIAKKRLSS